ncbi:hypothetical protein EVAR_8174_1 [Eumeta japonica]|uniref:Uncharacterized protein n=1 Tax=Eumeta variegata TaxID=151549 RepID=A0A4C1TGK4_EUMVA|nr:hypothetical protein EVAR_8174_1 [Eumeta japonica]
MIGSGYICLFFGVMRRLKNSYEHMQMMKHCDDVKRAQWSSALPSNQEVLDSIPATRGSTNEFLNEIESFQTIHTYGLLSLPLSPRPPRLIDLMEATNYTPAWRRRQEAKPSPRGAHVARGGRRGLRASTRRGRAGDRQGTLPNFPSVPKIYGDIRDRSQKEPYGE